MLVHTRWTGLVAGKPEPQVPHFTNGMQPQQDDYFGQAAPMAAQFGVNMVQTTIGKYLPFASALWQSLRYYFDVNNTYVQNKLRILLAPFRHKHWQRLPANESGGMQQDVYNPGQLGFASPIHDINAPDLYIPVMSFITFVLMTGLLKGTKSRFSPEMLNEITASCLVTQLLEMGAIKLGMYLTSSVPVPFFDLVAFTGYKYLNLVINTLVGLLLGPTAYYLALLYTGAVAVVFMANILQHGISMSQHEHANPKRNYLLIGVSCLQFVLIWWLGYSGDM